MDDSTRATTRAAEVGGVSDARARILIPKLVRGREGAPMTLFCDNSNPHDQHWDRHMMHDARGDTAQQRLAR
jgi:hypothetical protein